MPIDFFKSVSRANYSLLNENVANRSLWLVKKIINELWIIHRNVHRITVSAIEANSEWLRLMKN